MYMTTSAWAKSAGQSKIPIVRLYDLGTESMKKPAVLQPSDEAAVVGTVFNTPLVAKGKTWYPAVELITWPIMAWIAKKRQPHRSWMQSLGNGGLTMAIVLGSEWCHNLAHAAAARMVGKPMDAIRIAWDCLY